MLDISPVLEQSFRQRAEAADMTENQFLARLPEVHQPTAMPAVAPIPPAETPEETAVRVQGLLTKWQAEYGMPVLPDASKTLAELSAEWAAEDANLTEEEWEAERLFWEERERDYERRYGPKG